MKNKKKNQIKMLLSAFAVIGVAVLFSGSASAMMPGGPEILGLISKESSSTTGGTTGDIVDRGMDFSPDCRIRCDGYVPPPKNPFEEGDFSNAITPPMLNGGLGVPTARSVDRVTTADGVVDMGNGTDEAKDKDVSIPGIQDIAFAVDNGEKLLTGAEALDLAVMGDAHFEAGQFKQTENGIELCF